MVIMGLSFIEETRSRHLGLPDGVTPGVTPSATGYENLGRPVRHGGQILDLQSGSGEAMGLEINHAQLGSQEGGGQLNHVQQYITK